MATSGWPSYVPANQAARNRPGAASTIVAAWHEGATGFDSEDGLRQAASRHPSGWLADGSRYPFSPVRAIPWTKYRCRRTKMRSAGTVASTDPAMLIP